MHLRLYQQAIGRPTHFAQLDLCLGLPHLVAMNGNTRRIICSTKGARARGKTAHRRVVTNLRRRYRSGGTQRSRICANSEH